ncbi:MAG: DNA gyrase subunit A [Patescibacteria group bacterium]|nr:DNA gyrase subunit A [Patescibacteria group bacterium]
MEIGYVKPKKIVEEMKTSYLDYAMSIIVSRALPDVRDGLKPSQRRILYSMHNLGLSHQAKYRKSALVVGDVLGKYHPHGDMAVYDALVRLAQNFSLRYPLVDGQGNFGSIDGDSPAQMRYTECRMTRVSEEILKDIDKDTVDFIDNYDASRQEPRVMPAAVPQLLINGTVGIAVGMATNIPPHNMGEVMQALIYLIENPNCEIKELMRFVKGPDFPTGGFIYNKKDILEAYSTGKGRMVTRAKTEIVETKKDRFAIIVSEVTYQSNKAAVITKIADLVKQGKITGIKDIRDESDKDGIRVVIELKKDAYPKKVLNRLFQLTDLQKNFGLNMIALEAGIQPKVMNIKEVLSHFFNYRVQVVTRRTNYELRKARDRAHILLGLKIALDHIDAVIKTIRSSRTREIAHKNLMQKFKLSHKQSQAILEMRLQNLAGLERKKIQDELEEKKKLIKQLETLLKSKVKMTNLIKKELQELNEKYKDKRRTKVITGPVGEFSQEDIVPQEDSIIMISRGGYIKRMNPNAYKVQKRGGVGIIGASPKEDDVISHIFSCKTHDDIFFFTESGKAYITKAYEISEASRTSRGQAIANFLALPQREKITAIIPISSKNQPRYLFMCTKLGTIKRIKLEKLANIRKNGIHAIKLKGQDELWWVKPTNGRDEIILATSHGQSIRFKETDVREMGRVASGVRGINIKQEDWVVGIGAIPRGETKGINLLVITQKGFGKKTALSRYKVQKRGGMGIKTMKITVKNGPITHASLVDENNENKATDLIATSQNGNIIRISIKNIPLLGRATQGVKVMRLHAGDKLAQATKV